MPYKSAEQPKAAFLSRMLLETLKLSLPNPQPRVGHRIRAVLPWERADIPQPRASWSQQVAARLCLHFSAG